MKKILLLTLMITSILTFQNYSATQIANAEEIWIGKILFEEVNVSAIEHGFLINDLSYTLTKLHLLIADKDIEAADYEWEILAIIKKLEQLTKTDVIDLLNVSADKEVALTNYLTECDQEINKWDNISAYMKQEMEMLKSDMKACATDKNISDKAYFDAVDRYDQDIMDASLSDSLKYENCITENRIQYNAKTSIATKLAFYLWLLQKKYDILSKKQDIVAQNYDIFRDGILPDLNEIDELLKQYTF